MTATLSQPEPLVNTSHPTLLYFPASEEMTMAALAILAYVEPLYNSPDMPRREDRERHALLAASTIPYFRRNDLCVCVSCLRAVAEGDAFFYYCLRAGVAMVYGVPSTKIPHRSNVTQRRLL